MNRPRDRIDLGWLWALLGIIILFIVMTEPLSPGCRAEAHDAAGWAAAEANFPSDPHIRRSRDDADRALAACMEQE